MTYLELVTENHTLLQSILNVHILPAAVSWATMLDRAGAMYFPTCNTCATFYVIQVRKQLVAILKGPVQVED